MSTYNSKFSGAQIDELLTKVEEGKAGGSGGSEKEPVLKELGATHKHLCKLSAPADGMTIVVWFYLYNNIADAYTADGVLTHLTEAGLMVNGYMAYVYNGLFVISVDVKIGNIVFDESTTSIGLIFPGGCALMNVVSNVDFSGQTATSEKMPIVGYTPISLSEMISADGFTFTDTVTEL